MNNFSHSGMKKALKTNSELLENIISEELIR